MAVKPIKLPRLPANVPVVDSNGAPTIPFSLWWQSFAASIETAINGVIEAQNTANAAADAAAQALAEAEAARRQQQLTNSGISPIAVITATSTVISIAAHQRVYTDGTVVDVSAGLVAATGIGDIDTVWYSDPDYSGGVVAYQAMVGEGPVQAAGVHVVGSVLIPATGAVSGGSGPFPPTLREHRTLYG
jgi:hypothetical protein